MPIEFLRTVFRSHSENDAIVWRNQTFSYGWLTEAIDRWTERLDKEGVKPGVVVSLEADYSPNAVALMLGLVGRGCVIVPLTRSFQTQKAKFREVAQAEIIISVGEHDEAWFETTGLTAHHEILKTLKEKGRPGLVLFSSGSTGTNKAIVHDFVALLEKFRVPRHSLRSITFLLFDHGGGINTLFYNLSNAGCLIAVDDRSPDAVCAAIEKHRAQLLPTSPTFINLLLLSEAYKRYDLSSLQLVTYGTEVMPESTLKRFHELFPDVGLLQTYGLTEVGALRTKSKSSDSLWLKVGGEGYETRVVDGMLEVRAKSAMLGYLNAESPFTEDGWLDTGDAVEIDGEYIRILGRKSEVINVGGEKVYPAEVENIIQEMDNVAEVTVYAEKNAIVGNIVCAMVSLLNEEESDTLASRLKKYCRDRMDNYKVPVRITVVNEKQHNERFKKVRISTT